jgi:signal transduction histidine kinase
MAPLTYEGKLFGLLSVSSAKPHQHTPQEKRLLSSTSDLIAAAVTRFRLLEQVQTRAVELETVAEVSTAAATLLDVDTLLETVSTLTKENFNLYHAHIYLVDDTGDNLVLMGGAGEAGRIMKEKGRSIAITNEGSLVARAARTREGAIVNDVMTVSDFLPNPLLPDTRSEMAIPMIMGDRLIGVLDVQSEYVDRFTPADVRLKTTLAAQIAVAVENAQQYQFQVQTTEELRALDRLKSEFLASMSHELRTPLNSIIGYSRLLLDEAEETFSEDTVEDLGAIHNGGKHLLSLINDILDLAKIEAGKMEIEQARIKLDTVAHEVTQMTSILLKDKPVTLSLDIPAALPDLWADNVRLRQILNNLVSNAIKFTEEGEVRIAANYQANANEITVSVSDTGIGIEAEKLGLIFERFTQVDSSSARRAGGTGLGLTITRHLIQLHGGQIWADSTPDVGTTIYFTIPLASEILVDAA